MYRCCDCGCEYKVKPDFCDCGNNTFEEIPAVNIEPVESDEKIVPQKKQKKTFDEQYPELSGFMGSLDPISVIIFILCIVLSICSFIFIKPNEDTTAQSLKEEPKAERKVADINTFWNDTPPKPEPKIANQTPKTAENIVNQIINIIPKTEDTKPVPQKPKPAANNTNNQKSNTTVQKPVQTQTVKPKVQTTKPKTQTQQPTQTKKTVQTTKPKTNTSNQQQTQQQIKPANTIQQQPQNPTPQITQPQQQIQPKINTVSPQQAEQELKNFKRGLQSAYASRIKGNLLQVYGDGSCVIVFKVDSTGKITNRSFSQQSSNNTLNDAVYHSVMSMPSYQAPPSAYKGQTLHLSVKITNGMAQISVY